MLLDEYLAVNFTEGREWRLLLSTGNAKEVLREATVEIKDLDIHGGQRWVLFVLQIGRKA